MDVFLRDWVLLISAGIPSNQSRLLTFLKSSALSQAEGIDEMQVRVHRNWHFMLLFFRTTNLIGYLINFKGQNGPTCIVSLRARTNYILIIDVCCD